MQHQPILSAAARHRGWRADIILALVLAAAMSAAWAATDWARLSRLILPDTDDMMRLAQVHDWLGGQAFNDWTQHRVNPPVGGAMHWSRVNDLGIAGIILAATPLVGRHQAELTAVLCYPALLFAANILLATRIARRLWGAEAAAVAAVLAVLAYPGLTVFVPGRIDHHALQTVVIEAAVLALMRAPGWGGGAAAGLLCAVSLLIGLETAPQVAALVSVVSLLWAVKGMTERGRLAGFAAALGGATALFLAFMRPSFWSPALCDAFTPASSTGTLAVAAALGLLAAGTPRLGDWRRRMSVGILLGGGALAWTLHTYPACLAGPYGLVDPFLRRNYLPHIKEVKGLLSEPSFSSMLAFSGLVTAGCVASAWMVARRPRRWALMAPLVAVIAASALVTLAQVRGVYLGAPAVVPVLAGLVLAARRQRAWRVPALVAAWLASSGTAYAMLPGLLSSMSPHRTPTAPPPAQQASCLTGDVWDQLNRFPPGVVMTGNEMAAYVIGATHHATVGAGYHRLNSDIMAIYRYFLASPARAAAVARERRVRYVLFCPSDFSEIDVRHRWPDSVAARLAADRPPPGFRRLPLRDAALRFYRIGE